MDTIGSHNGHFILFTISFFAEKDQRLALIDFGLCADVPLPDTKNMTLAIVHLMQGDVSGLLDDSIELGFLPKDINKDTLLPALQKIFDDAQLAIKEEAKNQLKFKAIQTRRKRFMAVSTGKVLNMKITK